MTNDKNIQPDTLKEVPALQPLDTEIEQLRTQMQDMQLEIDILKEPINVLKKDCGIDMASLKNRERAVIVDTLKDKHSLPVLLERPGLSKSSHYYQETALRRKGKYDGVRRRISELFHENKDRDGLNGWKKPVWSVSYQKREILRTILLVRGCLAG